MDEQGKRIKEYVEAHGQEIIGDLVELTKAQSPTTCKELADACGQKIRELVKERVGIDGTIYPQEKRGDHMSFTLGEQKEQILMLAHFDTVWDKDALPLKQEGDVLYGPGAYDMKAGLVSAIWAMKICKELELPLHKRLCLLCNSDEEVGSGTSQALIEEKAKESAAALCLEPSQGQTGNMWSPFMAGRPMREMSRKRASAHWKRRPGSFCSSTALPIWRREPPSMWE